MHRIAHLEENEQDKVLLSLIVSKGSRKFSRFKKELRRKWMWYNRDTMVEIFNSKVAVSEAILKATYIEDKVKVGENNRVTPGNIIPLIGMEWSKKVHQGEKVKETLIKEIAKVLWIVYHKQAAIAIELLKKESKDMLLRVFGQEGVIQEWADKQGITLKYEQVDVFPEKAIQEGKDEATQAEKMGLKLKELLEGNEHGKRGSYQKNVGATLINTTPIESNKFMRI